MPIQNMAWSWGWALDNVSTSLAVNFPAQLAVALCSLSQAAGEGEVAGGLTEVRTASGIGDLGIAAGSYWLPPLAFDPQMTGVSAEIDAGDSQQGTMTLMVWLWT